MSTTATAPVAGQRSSRSNQLVLFAGTIFLSAFLLFQVQLIIAKFILPWFGGTPAVWTTCMLVFQLLLLAGYAYAHLLQGRLAPATQARLHVALLMISVAVLAMLAVWWKRPLLPDATWKPESVDYPVWRIIKLLLASIGLPFLLLSTTAPLLQRWYARGGRSPYRLYAVSNLGSLLGLLSYPFVIEPTLTLNMQSWVWSAGYALVACGVSVCALSSRNEVAATVEVQQASSPAEPEERISVGRVMAWLLLPACASAMLLATTNFICQEVAVIVFLWVAPLCVYLLSFVLCFDSPRWYRRSVFHPLYGVMLLAVAIALFAMNVVPFVYQIAVHCTALFVVAMVCHGEVYRLRPSGKHLTGFYLAIATGGALGGIFVALIAPRIFVGYWEYHIVILASSFLIFGLLLAQSDSWLHASHEWLAPAIVSAVLLAPYLAAVLVDPPMLDVLRGNSVYYPLLSAMLLLTLVVILRTRDRQPTAARFRLVQPVALLVLLAVSWLYYRNAASQAAASVARSRNFFGVLTVFYEADAQILCLKHGKIRHGCQFLQPEQRHTPTLYYARNSGIGKLLGPHAENPQTPLRVGVIGLGVGTLAAYERPGDYFHFYEINPDVLRYSMGATPYFTFLRDTRGTLDVSLGDARLVMEREAARGRLQKFDALVVDAFTSDAIPVHLLTKEAFELYRRHLRGPQSIVAFHISNRNLSLQPVLAGLARESGWTAKWVKAVGPPSDWVLMSADARALQTPQLKDAADPLSAGQKPMFWTDQFSDLARAIRWRWH